VAVTRPTGTRSRLAILLAASITLLTFGVRDVPVIRDAREAVGNVIDPVVGVVQAIVRPFGNAWKGLTDYGSLEDENADLRDRVAELESERVRSADAEERFAELSRAVDLPFAGDLPTVTAQVSSGPRSNFAHSVEIDKGSDDGIAVNMPVASGGGLVGRVSRASGSSATVELLSDPEFRVGVRLAESGELGTARGQGRGESLAVDTGIDPATEVGEGAGLVTSGVDRSAFPAGIPVGEVTETREASGGLALELVADPIVDLDDLSYVTVLRWEGPG
jgi:rod shape-determining protein MreC